ncbi:helix-turn-helix domain-containing protein [Myroides sp. WP-1]|uniref:AraC family transcriptional regulator n=1 Tax=Myroides sp. WP-1 TaxID=2759944 RepID=UPI0015FB2A1F|nr:helix-turn-helix domain-containing protein [Myroides sp. WP-1]MBB1140931.1 AraC family transcriptional regulator [Myroides sp. WP-1]
MDLKKDYEMKLDDWNVNFQVERYYFLLFVFFVFLLTVSCYFVLVDQKTTYIVNLYAIVFSIMLFGLTRELEDVILRTQILQIASLAVLLIIFSFLWVPLWIVVTLNNFFAVVYFGIYFWHQEKFKEQSLRIGAYINIAHFFFVLYLFLLNVQLYLIINELNLFILALNHVQVGVQCLILMISLFTYASMKKKTKETERETFSVSVSQWDVSVPEESEGDMTKGVELDRYQLKYRNQELGEQIIDFFESKKDFLQQDFTLEMMCNSIVNCSTQQASFVINNYLNTTFYKLVAYYRIIYSLQLLVNQPDWTMLAIAGECGFRSVNTFNKYFKDLTGFSPVDYRGVIEKSRVQV